MAEFVEAKRVVVIAESVLLEELISRFVELGAKGYNAVYCFGKGEHGIVEDMFSNPDRMRSHRDDYHARGGLRDHGLRAPRRRAALSDHGFRRYRRCRQPGHVLPAVILAVATVRLPN